MLNLPVPYHHVIVLNSYCDDGRIAQNIGTTRDKNLSSVLIHMIPKMLDTHMKLVGDSEIIRSWVLTMDSKAILKSQPINLEDYI